MPRGQTIFNDGVATTMSPTYTSATAAFTSADLFLPISGTKIPINTYIGIINSATSIGMSSSRTVNTPVNALDTGGLSLTFTIGTRIPISQKVGKLPLNYEFTTSNYTGILLQRMQLYLDGAKIILGSSDAGVPLFDIGVWWNTNEWRVWDTSLGKYVPMDIGFKSGAFGMTINAAPTANRTLTLPDAPATTFTDGASTVSSTTFTSATASFGGADIGNAIVVGSGILPPGTTIASVTNLTTVVLSAAATATASGVTFTIARTVATVADALVARAPITLTTTTPTINPALSSDFILTLEGNTTIAITSANLPEGGVICIFIINNGTSYTVTWPGSVTWPNATPPVQPTVTTGVAEQYYIYKVAGNLRGEAVSDAVGGMGFGASVPEPQALPSPGPYYGGAGVPSSNPRVPYNLP